MPNELHGEATAGRQAALVLGTSSWTFPGWRGVFYPPEVARNDWLAFYARHFAGVEVNTSFYALPAPALMIRWVESVPAGFVFSLKFPQQISHVARLVDCRRETLAFLDVLAALGPAAGPALLQLPPSFTRRSDGRALARYIEQLAELCSRQPQPNPVRIAVEVRAVDLMTEAFARFLAEHGMSLALVDREGSPDLFESWREVGATAGFAYLRWIGDDRNGPQGDAELVAPRDKQLAQWATRLAALHQTGVDVYGYMHNPYEGHAPASVRRLATALALAGVIITWSPPSAPQLDTQQPDEPQLRLL